MRQRTCARRQPAPKRRCASHPRPGCPEWAGMGRPQQAATAAAQATSRVISGFGQVAARLGMSGFFGGAPAGSKPSWDTEGTRCSSCRCLLESR